MTVDIATLAIRIDSTSVAPATANLDRMRDAGGRAEQQTTALESATRKLQGALALLGIGAGVGAVIRMADEYTKFTAQLHLATQSQREYAAALDDVRRIANTAQQDLAATGVLYARIANGTRELGIAQKQVASITEVVNLALKVSGATAAESASAMLQLSQSFASGTLRGEEFNAVNEAAPRLMKALADGIGVPVGALKQMASDGIITSKVMADVLPQALQQLQEEAKQVQTISGSFTVLKNKVLEFTATQAQANGTVSLLTGGIELLSNNLGLLMGVIGTVTAAKTATTFAQWATGAYASVAANRALLASNLAAANANVIAASAASATAAARERELRASVLAAEGVVALAIAENGLIPAQARATAAAQAHATALAAQTAASGAASVGAGLVRGALGLLGGPVGAVVTVLGLAATAWSWYSAKSEDANVKTAVDTVASTAEIVAQVEKQISVLERRNKMALSGVPSTKTESPLNNKIADVVAEMEKIGKAEGDYANLTLAARQDLLMKLGGQYGELTALVERFNKASTDGAGNTAAAKALIEIRERLTGVSGQYQKDLKAYQTALDEGVISIGDYKAGVSALAVETWKGSEAGKAQLAAQNKSGEAYKTLITSIREATATNRLELAAGIDATEGQKLRIKLDQELASGKVKLSAAQVASVRSALDEQAASEKLLKSQRSVAAAVAELTEQRRQDFATAAAESASNVQAAANFGLTKAQIEGLTVARLKDRLAHAADLELTTSDIAQTERLIAVMDRSAKALTKIDALSYIKQLSEENKKFAAESIFDEKARADAILAIDAANWQARITLAGEGTEAQRLLQEQYLVWYQNQLSKPQLDAQKQLWGSIESTAHDTFISIFDSGKSAFDRLRDTLKNGLLELLYQMTAKKWIMNIGASVSGVAGAAGSGIPGAAGAASNILSGAGSLSSIYNAATGSIAGSVGGGISSIGSFLGSTSIADFGAGLSGSASAEAMAAALAGDVAAPLSAAASAGSSLATAFSASVPWVAAAGAAYLVWKNFFEDGPEQNTHLTFGSNNAAGKISINERGNEGKNAAYIDNYGTSSLGTFGVTSSFWMSSDSDVVQSFIKTVSQTDDALAAFMTTTEKASVSSYLTGKSATAQTGAEGSNPNASGALDKVFADRINNILEGVEPGLSKLESGFTGTSQQLATEAAALLQYRTALKDSGQALFGAEVTLQQIAALKQPTEATSAALTRVANEFQATNQVASMLGVDSAKAFGAAGLASEAARAQVILLSGGLSSFTSQASDYAQNFLSDAQRMAPVAKQLDAALGSLGLSTIPTTKVQFAALVDQLVSSGALATEQGAKQFAGLMAVESAFAKVHAEEAAAVRSASDIASERVDLQKQLDTATLTSAQLLTKQRDALDASNKALFDQVQAATAAKAAADALASTNDSYQKQIDDLLKANMSAAEVRAMETKGMDASTVALYDRLAALHAAADGEKLAADAIKKAQESAAAATQSFGDALASSMNAARDAAKAFRELNDSLLIGDMSALSPEQKYAEAKRQFETADGSKLEAAEKAFLDASKSWFAGGAGYAADFAAVLARNSQFAANSDASAAAMPGIWKLFQQQMGGINGSHANGLDFVPFDGYRAELHKGERVQTAAAVRNGDQAAQETNALLREVLAELRADKVQRSAVGSATVDKLDRVVSKLDDTKRVLAKATA